MPDRKHLFRRGRTISPAATPKRLAERAAAPVEPIIEFRGVSLVHRSGALGLERATFAIARSELAFLTGPAGAGKSTVMRLLTKELEASGGSVWVAGRDLSRIARSGLARYRRNLGLVRHDSVLMADRSVQDQISRWVPKKRRWTSLGTDGFGRSDTRAALRRHFHVDAESIATAVLAELARRGEVESDVPAKAVDRYRLRDDQVTPAEPELGST